jgi:hypothetical protein
MREVALSTRSTVLLIRTKSRTQLLKQTLLGGSLRERGTGPCRVHGNSARCILLVRVADSHNSSGRKAEVETNWRRAAG